MGFRVSVFSFLFTVNGFLFVPESCRFAKRTPYSEGIQTEVLEVVAMDESHTEDEVGLKQLVIACIFSPRNKS